MAENKVTLGYWGTYLYFYFLLGIRGRAQPLRFLLEFGGVNWEDKQYSDPNAWFGTDKPALNTNFPSKYY